ncbi:uncharacterized protein LOC134250819 isoform X1 [Saccostrea cucullata]|uniref:uncharacterized protein LOC134250819 isoform X1 n=1 Tax=Saccostrea cuccullata TaxID=36930 RepID=UPI002ED25BD4
MFAADNGGILHKYLEEEKTAKNYKVSLEILGQEKGELESKLHLTKEKLAQTERELTVTKEEHKAEKSKLEEAFQGLKGYFPNLFTSTPAGAPNKSFQGPGLFVHGTGVSGSRRN